MREYELTYLVSDDVLEKDLNKVTGKISGIISAEGGKVSKEEIWGRRKLTYPIQKQNFATYVTIWFEIEKDKIVEIEHELRVNSQVIRHLITVKVAKEEELKVTKEDIVGTSEVEKVIGEKSFEVVEGETEASKDLMAVREKDEEETKEPKETETEVKAEVEEEKPAVEKKSRKTKIEKEVVEEAPVVEDKPEEEKPKKAPKAKKEVKPKEDEADRIKKLDEKLDELLGDDL